MTAPRFNNYSASNRFSRRSPSPPRNNSYGDSKKFSRPSSPPPPKVTSRNNGYGNSERCSSPSPSPPPPPKVPISRQDSYDFGRSSKQPLPEINHLGRNPAASRTSRRESPGFGVYAKRVINSCLRQPFSKRAQNNSVSQGERKKTPLSGRILESRSFVYKDKESTGVSDRDGDHVNARQLPRDSSSPNDLTADEWTSSSGDNDIIYISGAAMMIMKLWKLLSVTERRLERISTTTIA